MIEVDTSRSGVWTQPAWQQLRWLTAGLVIAFAVPFVFADVLDLPRDLYYGIYAASVVVFFHLMGSVRHRLPQLVDPDRRRMSILLPNTVNHTQKNRPTTR